jgi:Cu/Ag efflux pump CusA
MVERIIELSVRYKWAVFGAVLALAILAADSVRKTPLDALPDLSDPQVIVYTEWMGRSPDLVEDQITYPLVRALQSTPGVQTVRGYSMFGMSFTYAKAPTSTGRARAFWSSWDGCSSCCHPALCRRSAPTRAASGGSISTF